MSTNGETADLMVREGIQITESAVKLAGLGAKNLAALLIAVANDNQKLAGKTTLKRLIQDGDELTIFSVKKEDLDGFRMEAKSYGVLFCPIVNKMEKTGTVEIMAKAKDAQQLNRIFERMGYPAPVREDTAKKADARAPSASSSKERGNGARAFTEQTTAATNEKPSVKARLAAYKAVADAAAKAAPAKEAVKEAAQKSTPER
ncbi:MAG: PcfB family protein [Oscillospiraceae bacterium]|nr:PcfB family protein [Oscillospiraceae bacterium]